MALQPTSGPSGLPSRKGGFDTPPSPRLGPELDSVSIADTDEEIDPSQAVLQSHDLLTDVFDHLAIDPTASDQDILQVRTDLFAAARVCKAFVEPALDALWRTLPSLIPLLRLLPSFGELDGVHVIEDIREDDWERYDVHARRIRVLDLRPSQTKLAGFVYPSITQERKRPLLPSLRELRIPDNTSIDLTLASILSTPELHVVELRNNAIKDTQFSYPFLASLNAKHPCLRHLVLDGDHVVNLQPVLRMVHLRKLELRLPNVHFSPSFMEQLGSMDNLYDLTIHTGVATPNVVPEPIRREPLLRRISTPSNEPRPLKFAKVKYLHVIGTLRSVVRVMEYMKLRSLISFTVTELEDDAGSAAVHHFWQKCFIQLAQARSLETVEFNQFYDRRSLGYSLSGLAIEPLFNLRSLRSLVINTGFFSATGDHIAGIALAFPSLQKLVFPDSWYASIPAPSILSNFATACPKLEELRLHLTLADNQDLQSTLDLMTKAIDEIPRRHDHPLRRLYLNSSLGKLSSTQSIQFAKFLDCAFPNLQVLQGYGDQSFDNYWSVVREFQASLQEWRKKLLDGLYEGCQTLKI